MMMKDTLDGDFYNRLTEKCLLMLLTKNSVGRYSEGKYLNVNHLKYNIFCDFLDTLWVEMNNLVQYLGPFVTNKTGYATCILYSLGCYFACGNLLFHNQDKDGKINPYLIPHISGMVSSNVSGWLTQSIRQYFPDEVPNEYSKSVSSVSLRVAGVK